VLSSILLRTDPCRGRAIFTYPFGYPSWPSGTRPILISSHDGRRGIAPFQDTYLLRVGGEGNHEDTCPMRLSGICRISCDLASSAPLVIVHAE